MAKKIALVVLTFALVVAWGVLPAMAYDCPVQIKQAEELLKKPNLRGESPAVVALVAEAKKLLVEAQHGDATGKAAGGWQTKTEQAVAEEIAAPNHP